MGHRSLQSMNGFNSLPASPIHPVKSFYSWWPTSTMPTNRTTWPSALRKRKTTIKPAAPSQPFSIVFLEPAVLQSSPVIHTTLQKVLKLPVKVFPPYGILQWHTGFNGSCTSSIQPFKWIQLQGFSWTTFLASATSDG